MARPLVPFLLALGTAAAVAQERRSDVALDGDRVAAVLAAPRLDQVAFAAIVRSGASAVPALLEVLESAPIVEPLPPRHARALRALRLIGPAAADLASPRLLELLAWDASRDDVELLDTLAVLAPGVTDRPGLLAATKERRIQAPQPQLDMDAFRRWVAKMRLWYRWRRWLATDASADVGVLTAQLADEDPLTRERAARVLGALGPSARSALDALVTTATTERHPRIARSDVGNLTADFHDLVRDAAAIAVARIDPESDAALRGLALLVQGADDPTERLQVAAALARHGDGGVDALLLACESDDDRLVGEAVTALGTAGLRRDDVLARLRVLAGDPRPAIARRAAASLRALERR